MQRLKGLSIVIFSCFVFFVSFPVSAQVAPISYASAVQKAAPSVVNVRTVRNTRTLNRGNLLILPRQKIRRSSLGSGVIVDKKGHILTNYHVVRNGHIIAVSLADGRKAIGKLIGHDAETDLAVLQIKLSDLTPAELGDSDKVEVGDVVLAIGNPFGLGQTVTQGIISAIGRSTVGINQLENYIQTDAAINPGNSGGALVDTGGKVIGINTGIYSQSGGYQGVGFAIPVNVALNVMQQIIKTGFVERGWLGVRIRTLNSNIVRALKLKQSTGIVIAGVVPKSPAAGAGIKIGDVITRIDRQRVRSARGFLNYIAQRKPGSTLTLTLWRKGDKRIISVVIGKRPAPPILDERSLPDQKN